MSTVWGPVTPSVPRPPDLPAAVDVAVVGAGFAGLSVAADLLRAAPGLRLVVLDAAAVGAGASGRNAGGVMPLTVLPWLLPGGAGRFDGRHLLRVLHTRVSTGMATLAAGRPDLGITPAQLRMLPTCRVTAAGVGVIADRLAAADLPADVAAVPGTRWPALVLPGWVAHPTRLLAALVADVVALGGVVHEHVAVAGVQPGRGTVALHVRRTDGGPHRHHIPPTRVTAAHVVIATGGRTSSVTLPDPPRARETRTFVRAGGPLTHADAEALGGTGVFSGAIGSGMAYWRIAAERLLFGGTDLRAGATASAAARRRAHAALDRLLARRLPQHATPAALRWDGRLHVTPAEVPVIRTSAASPNLHYALGFAGSSGIALTTTCGPWVRDLVLGPAVADPLAAEVRAALAATRLPPRAAVGLAVAGARRLVAVRAIR